MCKNDSVKILLLALISKFLYDYLQKKFFYSPFFTLLLFAAICCCCCCCCVIVLGTFVTTFEDFCDVAAEKGEGKSAAAVCCGVGGLRCRKEWLKNTSNGILSFALRLNNPISIF